jgi:hypothetical protein
MKLPSMKYTVLSVAATLISIVLFLMPFHAFLTVWAAALFGHYIAFRLWKEVFLLVIALCAGFLLLTDHKIRSHTLSRHLVWIVLTYCAFIAGWGLLAYLRNDITLKAVGYGLISDLRFPVFFLLAWAVALRTNRLHKRSQKFILLPAAIVALFGVLQVLILPRDFLAHFGYNANTISPFETINHNVHYVRIASTLRGANPLGTYMIIPISLLTILVLSAKRRWQDFALLASMVFCLFFSFSRGAWIGTVVSVLLVLGVYGRRAIRKQHLLIGGAILLVGLGLIGVLVHRNARLENIVLHTEAHSSIKTTSNQGHISATISGIRDVLHHPFGQGVGTSGPASVYNNKTRIPENYYLQIAEEAGWFGIALFLLMNAGVGYLLWLRRHDPLALCLVASLVGISVVNLFSQAWADDTLAYVWWGLAGIAMVNLPTKKKS